MLYDRYAQIVYAVALRVLRHQASAEELIEEIFVEIWRAPEKLSASHGNLGASLLLTTRNKAIAVLRRKPYASNKAFSPFLSYDLSNETERTAAAKRVSLAVAPLSRDQRKILDMAFYDGLTMKELTEVTAEPIPLLKQKMTDTLFTLREASFV